MGNSKIIYTKTDEAPYLATHSFLPLIKAFTSSSSLEFELKDISLASRILSHFPESLSDDQKINDELAWLGDYVKKPGARIIKLPNISASIPQLKAAISELRSHGFMVPEFPGEPQNEEEKAIRKKYSKVLGSAVNPILREGNSDRRVAKAVKKFAKANPHSMGAWDKNSRTHVASMKSDDFYGNETSTTLNNETTAKIIFEDGQGVEVLKDNLTLLAGEVIDASVMRLKALQSYFKSEIEAAKSQDILLSLHMKATMMKVSDPKIFGHAIKVYFSDLFDKYAKELDECGANPNNGLADVLSSLESLANGQQIKNEFLNKIEDGPRLAMVDSDKGITNLHIPSDVIIDASMPAAIRSSGKMWGADGELHDTKMLIPDRSYAGVYQAVIDFCREKGAFDPTTMGNVSNVGLMAKKAEEYGSHDKTFEIKSVGKVKVLDGSGSTLLEHSVEPGDIWRMCQTKNVAIKDWVRLGVERARQTGNPAIFWLDKKRAHDNQLIKKVNACLKEHDTNGITIKILPAIDATKESLEIIKNGKDVISVTGNVLRDYLTDLFPILELGTSAKMLSIVPLLAGGGLYETGAGGSAPKHVQQFQKENHLRWDSLGEFLALQVALEDVGRESKSDKIQVLAQTLDEANSRFLKENKSPSRKVKELDNRGSHYYLSLFWAEALAGQTQNDELKQQFSSVAEILRQNETKIIDELNGVQGVAMDMKGYYHPDEAVVAQAMRPSETFNQIIQSLL